MNIFISIVSHGHDNFIIKNDDLIKINKHQNVYVVIKDNINSLSLNNFCKKHKFNYLASKKPFGFGKNNNDVFDFCKKISFNKDDFFIVFNPDLIIKSHVLINAIKHIAKKEYKLSTIKLFNDLNFTKPGNHVRKFPTIKKIIISFFSKSDRYTYDTNIIKNDTPLDWSNGSLLIFSMYHYNNLNGFDERFFMYCEDIDICRRSLIYESSPIYYLPQFKAVHIGQRKSRAMFNKNFIYHLTSLYLYFTKKY